MNLPALASGLAWDDTNLYTTGEFLVLLSQIAGHFDSDGDVDGDDFLIWQNNFPYPTAMSSVPEPNSLALLAIGATGSLVYRRRMTYQIGRKICKGESKRRKTLFKEIRCSDKTYN